MSEHELPSLIRLRNLPEGKRNEATEEALSMRSDQLEPLDIALDSEGESLLCLQGLQDAVASKVAGCLFKIKEGINPEKQIAEIVSAVANQ
jgi:hypothetical protein